MFVSVKNIPRERKKVLRTTPTPQIRGSALGNLAFRLVERTMPSGTPTIPDIIVTIPKTSSTLSTSISRSSGFFVRRPFLMKSGPNQATAPRQNVTQVKPRVEKRKLLFLARQMMSS